MAVKISPYFVTYLRKIFIHHNFIFETETERTNFQAKCFLQVSKYFDFIQAIYFSPVLELHKYIDRVFKSREKYFLAYNKL